jgi:hypothetical protein
MIQWSFSGLKDFKNCPKQYQEVKILRNYVKSTTPQMLYGTEVHKALEDYVRDSAPLAQNYKRFQPVADALLEIPGTRYPENKMALTYNKTPCDFDAPDYWVRGIVDLLIVDKDTAHIVDYKTGSAKYPDPDQLKLMAAMTFAFFPEVNFIKAGLIFVMHEVFVEEQYRRDEIDKLWRVFEPTLMAMDYAKQSGVYAPKPTPLCGWCPVDTCTFHKKYSRRM